MCLRDNFCQLTALLIPQDGTHSILHPFRKTWSWCVACDPERDTPRHTLMHNSSVSPFNSLPHPPSTLQWPTCNGERNARNIHTNNETVVFVEFHDAVRLIFPFYKQCSCIRHPSLLIPFYVPTHLSSLLWPSKAKDPSFRFRSPLCARCIQGAWYKQANK
jgi:hypothetical protein